MVIEMMLTVAALGYLAAAYAVLRLTMWSGLGIAVAVIVGLLWVVVIGIRAWRDMSTVKGCEAGHRWDGG